MKINIDLIDKNSVEVCRVLNEAGFQAYIVGGCVRDLIRGDKPKDWDIATDALPEEVINLFPKTYPTGLQHGTVTVSMGNSKELHYEVTTFRTENEYSDGRHPDKVTFVKDIKEDLMRRDFTINAMAYDPITNQLVDPFNGIQDIENKVIKAVGHPIERFREDSLRIMRAARFVSRFDYTLEHTTLTGMAVCSHLLDRVSKERIKDELCKILMSDNPACGLDLLKAVDVLEIICPHLMSEPALTAFLHEQNNCKGELETRIAFLYANCTDEKAIEQELISLKLSNKEIKRTMFLIKLLDIYDSFKRDNITYTTFMAMIKNHSPDPWEHTFEQFIKFTEYMGIGSIELLEQYKNVVVFSRKEMKINGDDLLLMGIKPGPQIKSILDSCYSEILKNPLNNNEIFLLSFASGNWKIEKVSSIN